MSTLFSKKIGHGKIFGEVGVGYKKMNSIHFSLYKVRVFLYNRRVNDKGNGFLWTGAMDMEEKMGRRERKKLLSRKAILDAAVREFSRKGFKETSVADIMNAADLGIGTFYNYFESKEEILMCLLGRLVDEVDEALAGMRAARRPSYELLEAGSRITARFLDENRFLLPLFLSAAEHSAKPQAKMPKGMVTPGFKPIFEDILREGQLAGEIRDDVSAELIAEMFHSIYQAAAFSKLPIGFQENVALKTRLLLAGIRKQ